MKKIYLIFFVFILGSAFGEGNNTEFLTKKQIKLGNYIITVEIADNPNTHQRGLMYRRALKENHGMLFVFDTSEILSFWMKNTYIPLDIGFFDENRVLIEVHTMNPLSLDLTTSSRKAMYALELRKDWFKDHNIKSGISFSFLDNEK